MTQSLVRLLLIVTLVATAGCSLFRDKDETGERDPSETAARLFERSNYMVESGNYAAGIAGFETLIAIYPFSEEARQAQLTLMYAYWRDDQPEMAVISADNFILENPTHPRVDYALYIKGLARFPKDRGPMERLFRVNVNKRPPGEILNSFNTFAQLLQQHPNSAYVDDARQRMIYLRNRLAAHEVTVADFYLRREAHVAAINRARYILENYQETPSIVPALKIMAKAYENLDMPELAADTRRIIAANSAQDDRPGKVAQRR